MKKIYIILNIFLGVLIYAQGNIGVKTVSPLANLDINGDLNIGKKIFLDNGSGVLRAGTGGQLLVSRGPNNSPTWKTLRIPEYLTNQFYLIFNDSYKDFDTANPNDAQGTVQGLRFVDNQTVPTAFDPSTELVVDATLANLQARNFRVISSLTKNFTVNSTISSAYFMFETVVQQNNSGGNASDVKFACGIFVDGLLKSARINMLPRSPNGNTFITHTQIGGVENISPGTHSVSVGCARLTNPLANITLGIGVPATATITNLNNFMTQSSLKVDVYEIPQNFSPVIIP